MGLAVVHFDRDVRQPDNAGQALLVEGRRLGAIRDDRHNQPAVSGTEAPQVQVGHAIVPTLEAFTDFGHQVLAGNRIEQHSAGRSDQTSGPLGDDERAHDGHDRVEPNPVEEARREQGDDRQDRRQGVGEHMQVGRADIGVATVRFVVAGSVMMVVVEQQPGAEEIDG